MELAERTEESADDMTAAEMAPNPMNDTQVGVRCWRTMGSTRRVSLMVPFSNSEDFTVVMLSQLVDVATDPISTAGIERTMQPAAATNERIWARPADLEESTRWKYTCHGMP